MDYGHIQFMQRTGKKYEDFYRETGIDINSPGAGTGMTLLMRACFYPHHIETTRWLLKNKADTEIRFNDGYAAIDFCIYSNNTQALRELLAAGANKNKTDDDGWTPLHLAASIGIFECAEILLDHGADAKAKTNMGITPLQAAEISRDEKMIRLIKEKTQDQTSI